MNVDHILKSLPEAPANSVAAWENILTRRQSTFMGFINRESEKGIIVIPASLASPKGQDSARLLFFRSLEEYVEASSASSNTHVLEEIIDAINYALSCLFIEQTEHQLDSLSVLLHERSEQMFSVSHRAGGRVRPIEFDVGRVAGFLARLTEQFRNRSWMEQAQDVIYDGHQAYTDTITKVVLYYLGHFHTWESFHQLYVAKDEVLKFRLRSAY